MIEVEQFIEQAVFPVVAKAAEAWRLPAGVTRTLIADHPERLVAHYRSASGPEGSPNLLLQEYIPDQHGEDWIFHGYCDAEGDCPLRFTGRKLRSYPAFAGVTCLGRAAANPVLARLAEGLLKDIAYSGIVDLDYRLDRRDGQYKLLDFNPRAGAQFRLFESESGLDVVRALYLDLTGQAVERSPQRDGRVFVLEPYDLVSGARYVKTGRLTLREWCSTLRGRREWAWFAWDDPLPFLAMVLRLVKRAVQRLRPRSPWWLGRLPAGSASKPQY
jgi:predicted ATP-grasp superfamily ATP-dependent carboligase